MKRRSFFEMAAEPVRWPGWAILVLWAVFRRSLPRRQRYQPRCAAASGDRAIGRLLEETRGSRAGGGRATHFEGLTYREVIAALFLAGVRKQSASQRSRPGKQARQTCRVHTMTAVNLNPTGRGLNIPHPRQEQGSDDPPISKPLPNALRDLLQHAIPRGLPAIGPMARSPDAADSVGWYFVSAAETDGRGPQNQIAQPGQRTGSAGPFKKDLRFMVSPRFYFSPLVARLLQAPMPPSRLYRFFNSNFPN